MSFDLSKTLSLVKGGILDPQTTWNHYLGENPSWQRTATELAGPLIVANLVLSLLLSRIGGGYFLYGYPGNFLVALILGLVMSVAGLVIAVFVFNILAGPFKGKPDFSRAFAALSLAAIPAWVAGPLGALIPWIGVLIVLAGSLLSLVYTYRIMPLALEVPDGSRLVHFIVSMLGIIIINYVLGALLAGGMMGGSTVSYPEYTTEQSKPSVRGSGFFGEIQRQGELMEQASADVFDPPADGKLDEEQVIAYVGVLRKTRALQDQYAAEMQRLSEEMEAQKNEGKQPSLGDLSKVYGGVGRALGANNAEMEVVKTAGGNWAEHMWIKEQLRVANIQQGEGSESLAHNYALYLKYKDEL